MDFPTTIRIYNGGGIMAETHNVLAFALAGSISKGNPGALTVCSHIINEVEYIDPDNILGGVGVMMQLDTLGVYGPRVWMLFKDVCGQHLGKILAVLRAHQLGLVTADALNHAIDNYGNGIDVEALVTAVQERLPNFRLEPAVA